MLRQRERNDLYVLQSHGPARLLLWVFDQAPTLERKNSTFPCFANSVQSVSQSASIRVQKQPPAAFVCSCIHLRRSKRLPNHDVNDDCIIPLRRDRPLDKYKQDIVHPYTENRFFHIQPKRWCCLTVYSR